MFDFPSTGLTVGQILIGPGGIAYQWDGTKWVASPLSTAFAPLASPVFTGDPQAPTAAVGDNDTSIATTAFVQTAVTPLTHNVGRNLVHNGLFNIWQRGNGPFNTVTYTADRWVLGRTTDTTQVGQYSLTDGNRAAIGDESAINSINAVVAGNAVAGSYSFLGHPIEGVRRLSGKTVTVSFWATGGAAGLRLGVSIDQITGSGGSPSTNVLNPGQSVALGTTFARYALTFTMPSASGLTLGTNGNDNSQLNFWLSASSTFATRSGNVPVQSGNIWLWGVQLEIGSVATPLEKLDPRLDLANCQRFYETGRTYLRAYAAAGASAFGAHVIYAVTKRAGPTVNFVSPGYGNASGAVAGDLNPDGFTWQVTPATTADTIFNSTWAASADL